MMEQLRLLTYHPREANFCRIFRSTEMFIALTTSGSFTIIITCLNHTSSDCIYSSSTVGPCIQYQLRRSHRVILPFDASLSPHQQTLILNHRQSQKSQPYIATTAATVLGRFRTWLDSPPQRSVTSGQRCTDFHRTSHLEMFLSPTSSQQVYAYVRGNAYHIKSTATSTVQHSLLHHHGLRVQLPQTTAGAVVHSICSILCSPFHSVQFHASQCHPGSYIENNPTHTQPPTTSHTRIHRLVSTMLLFCLVFFP